ncbi:2-dehydro-3-deoxygluconokinase [Maribacter vaceletii]|uniref:2-dehydro-3-deoxygluconokinase n=1 Tax=Maribacter vaceletii TaxID=1206816 RepID=A0A495ECQ4_9FLAO|nr:sugar kinase [Maribacter vaceletii]RKR14409.1 2-dehydro-3-deoxygluconokinase [Maribacter vaceletii]
MSFTTFGEIMLRLTPNDYAAKINSAKNFGVHFAGSESNVASSLAYLGNKTQFVTKLPKNQLGDAAVNSLRFYGINTNNILRGGNRVGTYFIEIGSSIRPSSVIYDRENSAIASIKNNEFDWEKILEGQKHLFISGITPALSKHCADEVISLAKVARKLNVKVSFDMNYRRTLWSDVSNARKIFDAILENTDILFGNMGVLNDVYGMTGEGSNSIDKTVDIITKAKNEFCLNELAFTVRDHYSANENGLSGIYIGANDPIVSDTYKVQILDRFGTGDAFAAGCLHGLNKKWDKEKVIGFATAAFALKHTIKGDQHTSNEEEINSIRNGNITGHVLR